MKRERGRGRENELWILAEGREFLDSRGGQESFHPKGFCTRLRIELEGLGKEVIGMNVCAYKRCSQQIELCMWRGAMNG